MKALDTVSALDIQFCPPTASPEFYEMILQFVLNLAVLLIISRALYFRWNRKPEYLFAQVITGITVFLICAMLRWLQLGLGLALGLFAIFAIIRFRTINVPIKEIAYLFMVVGISSVNALLRVSSCFQWIIFANVFIVGLTFILERVYFNARLNLRTIIFNHTDMLKPSKHELLLKELKELTELNIVRFEIGKVDYIKNQAQIRIFFSGDGLNNFTESVNGNDDD
jgi:hypothetical protein